MPTILEMIRQSAVPVNVMRSAARGSLDVPAPEKFEILVFLSSHPLFGKEAQMTLAGWDSRESNVVAADPATSFEVLDYLLRPENRRPALIPALLENPSVAEAALVEMALEPKREIVEMMLGSLRVRRSASLLNALAVNQQIQPVEREKVRSYAATLAASAGQSGDKVLRQFVHEQASAIAAHAGTPLDFTQAATEDEQDRIVRDFLLEHAEAIAAEEGTAFQFLGSPTDEDDTAAAPDATMTAEQRNLKMRAAEAASRVRLSTLQKLARMSVGERVQSAMKGSKDERAILIRDGSKVVALAVLSSPKISASEIETFASLKNVQESILREIARNRKFLKNYGVLRNLTANPRCPLDVSLTLVKNLIMNDLKTLSSNKNLPDTLRKVALKHYKERSGPPK